MRSFRHQALLLGLSVVSAGGIGVAVATVRDHLTATPVFPLISTYPDLCCGPPAPLGTPAPLPYRRTPVAPRPASVRFSGPLTGTVDGDVGTCQSDIPSGTPAVPGGWMTMPATIAGVEYTVVIYSVGPGPGRVTGIEVDRGSSVGTDDFYERSAAAGISGFDWASGATLDVDVPPAHGGSGAPLHVQGSIGCLVDQTP